jgi:tetratricopeptide (TPR) repeat protein
MLVTEKSLLYWVQTRNFDEGRRRIEAERGVLGEETYFHYLSVLVVGEGNIKEGVDLIKKNIKIWAETPLAVFINLVTWLNALQRYKEAIPIGELALKTYRDHRLAMALATAYLDTSKVEETINLLKPFEPELKNTKAFLLALAACYRTTGEREKALEYTALAKKNWPKDSAVLRTEADLIGEVDSRAAVRLYKESLKHVKDKPSEHIVRWNCSLHLLRSKQWKVGFDFYESGLTKYVGSLGRQLPTILRYIPHVKSIHEIDSTKPLLIVAEQGIGDQVVFLSMLGEFLKHFPNVFIAFEERMLPILRRSFASLINPDRFVTPGFVEFVMLNRAIFNTGFLTIGGVMGIVLRDLEAPVVRHAYLTPNDKIVSRARRLLLAKANGRPIIGISWRGGHWYSAKKGKSLTIEDWIPLFKSRPALYVNLQYGDVTDDLDKLKDSAIDVVSIGDVNFKEDLESWTAIGCACDGILSISTSLVHFMGAMGQKVGVILPSRQGPFIWGIDLKRSDIYPNVYIFRNSENIHQSIFLEQLSSVIKM